MTGAGTGAPTRTRDRVAWLRLGGAAIAWAAVYAANRPLWDWVVFDVAGLEEGSHLADGVHFFLYDTVKITLLLGGIVFAVGVLRTFVSVERTREWLEGRRRIVGYALLALAIAVFTLADMMGAFGHLVTIIFGNIFMIVLEGGIVMIQVLRLEFYEGFARYFSGDGHEFAPLKLRRTSAEQESSS